MKKTKNRDQTKDSKNKQKENNNKGSQESPKPWLVEVSSNRKLLSGADQRPRALGSVKLVQKNTNRSRVPLNAGHTIFSSSHRVVVQSLPNDLFNLQVRLVIGIKIGRHSMQSKGLSLGAATRV